MICKMVVKLWFTWSFQSQALNIQYTNPCIKNTIYTVLSICNADMVLKVPCTGTFCWHTCTSFLFLISLFQLAKCQRLNAGLHHYPACEYAGTHHS